MQIFQSSLAWFYLHTEAIDILSKEILLELTCCDCEEISNKYYICRHTSALCFSKQMYDMAECILLE